ncbi:prephenate dehydratase [Staphylococcus borealis]|uniref:prephenate dehydratase n=1 Tax=Staphylococcus borealis TaxID=2742203 RepID=UPI00211BCC14|nr:prephenate dehydratase domain-containing protein [Staphylococcus borealis]MCQ9279274.1 prephenate dehydratase [Staphylococcus borealis]
MRLYYLGPKGTFSYLAAKTYLSEEEVTYSPKSNLYEVIKAVNSHSNAVGIVPIENSIEGTINIVADALAQEDIYAHGEIHLDINFGLYALKGTSLEDIEKVYSIAPAISQTSQYIHRHHFLYDYVDSTIQSLEKIDTHVAAIAPLGSGEAYGFEPIDAHIQDYPHNVTRFLVVKSDEHYSEIASSTLLLITPKHDKAGLLASILNTFALFDINLSWIESRPLKTQLGMYRFFVQTDIGKSEELDKVISILETLDFSVKIIGAFNRQ